MRVLFYTQKKSPTPYEMRDLKKDFERGKIQILAFVYLGGKPTPKDILIDIITPFGFVI